MAPRGPTVGLNAPPLVSKIEGAVALSPPAGAVAVGADGTPAVAALSWARACDYAAPALGLDQVVEVERGLAEEFVGASPGTFMSRNSHRQLILDQVTFDEMPATEYARSVVAGIGDPGF
jgi:hypothetical protein